MIYVSSKTNATAVLGDHTACATTTTDSSSHSNWTTPEPDNVIMEDESVMKDAAAEEIGESETKTEDDASSHRELSRFPDFECITSGTTRPGVSGGSISRRSCVNSKVRWLMYQTIQPQLESVELSVAAQWILCHCHKQLPYDRNWWSRIERQHGRLSMDNADVARQVHLLNTTLHAFARQLVNASSAVKKYIDGIDPVTNTLRKRDWNASTSLSEWISGDRGLLIKKLANDDPDIRHIKPYLPNCLCEENLREALHNGGILVCTEPHGSAATHTQWNGRGKRFSGDSRSPFTGRSGTRRGARYSGASCTYHNDNSSTTSSRKPSLRHQQQLNLVRPGAADTRMLDITLMDGAVLPVRRSRCSLGIPPAFVSDPVVVPKICVYDFSNGLHLYIFYRGHKMGKRKRPRFLLTAAPRDAYTPPPTSGHSSRKISNSELLAFPTLTPPPQSPRLHEDCNTLDDSTLLASLSGKTTCQTRGLYHAKDGHEPAVHGKSVRNSGIPPSATQLASPSRPPAMKAEMESVWLANPNSKRLCSEDNNVLDFEKTPISVTQVHNVTASSAPSSQHTFSPDCANGGLSPAVTVPGLRSTACHSVAGLPPAVLRQLLPGFTPPDNDVNASHGSENHIGLGCHRVSAKLGAEISVSRSGSLPDFTPSVSSPTFIQIPSMAFCPEAHTSGVSAISRNPDSARCHRTPSSVEPRNRVSENIRDEDGQELSATLPSFSQLHSCRTPYSVVPSFRASPEESNNGRPLLPCGPDSVELYKMRSSGVFYKQPCRKDSLCSTQISNHENGLDDLPSFHEDLLAANTLPLSLTGSGSEDLLNEFHNHSITGSPMLSSTTFSDQKKQPHSTAVISAPSLRRPMTTTTIPVQTVFVGPDNCTYLFNANLLLDVVRMDDDEKERSTTAQSSTTSAPTDISLPFESNEDGLEGPEKMAAPEETNLNGKNAAALPTPQQCFFVQMKNQLHRNSETRTTSSTCASEDPTGGSVSRQVTEDNQSNGLTPELSFDEELRMADMLSTSCASAGPTCMEPLERSARAVEDENNLDSTACRSASSSSSSSCLPRTPSDSHIARHHVADEVPLYSQKSVITSQEHHSSIAELNIREIPLKNMTARLTNVTLLMMRSD